MLGSRCKYCTEAIGFVRTVNGERMPVDLISCRESDDAETLYDPARHHRHDCAGAGKARKKKKQDPWSPPKP